MQVVPHPPSRLNTALRQSYIVSNDSCRTIGISLQRFSCRVSLSTCGSRRKHRPPPPLQSVCPCRRSQIIGSVDAATRLLSLSPHLHRPVHKPPAPKTGNTSRRSSARASSGLQSFDQPFHDVCALDPTQSTGIREMKGLRTRFGIRQSIGLISRISHVPFVLRMPLSSTESRLPSLFPI